VLGRIGNLHLVFRFTAVAFLFLIDLTAFDALPYGRLFFILVVVGFSQFPQSPTLTV
jgi:hypothetical protein